MRFLKTAVLLLLFCLPCHAAITVVQSASTHATTTSQAQAFGSNNASGNNIYVACSATGAGGTDFTVSDTKGNSYTRIDTQSQSNAQLQTWQALNIASGANTVTCALTGTTVLGIAIMEVSGTKTSSIIDVQSNSGSIATGPTVQPGSITNTQASEIFITAVSDFLPPGSNTINSGYTIATDTAYVAIAYKIVSSTGATNPTWTGNGFLYAQNVGWKASVSATPTCSLPLLGAGPC